MKKIFTILFLILLIPSHAFALNSEQRFEIERRPAYDKTNVPCGPTSIASPISSTLPNDLPEPIRTVFTQAANSQQTDPLALTSLYMVENGIRDYKQIANRGPNLDAYNRGWATSSAGAQGPFQFLPSTWKADFGDINNITDASNAAAKVFLKDVANIPASGAPDGDLAKKEKGSLSYLFGSYNGGPGYTPPSVQGYVEQALKNYKSLQTGSSSTATTASSPTTAPATTTATPATNTSSTPANSSPGKVFIVGDSIMAQSSAKVNAAFVAKGWTTEIDGLSNRGLNGSGGAGAQPSGLDALKAKTSSIQQAKAVVIEEGTNRYNEATFETDLKAAIKIVKDANPQAAIYWVDLAAESPVPAGLNKAYEPFNKIIYNNTSAGYKVISWFKTVYPSGDPVNISPSLVDTNGLINDGDQHVHPTDPAGQDALATLISSNVINGGGTATTVTGSTTCQPQTTDGVGTCLDDGRIMKINDPAKVATAINTYAEQKGFKDAPLGNLGDKFVSGAQRAGVNPFLEVHIAIQESGMGKAIPDNSFNSFGRTATNSQPHVVTAGRNWYKYDSFADSLDGGGTKDDQPTYIKKVYLDAGKFTIKDIMLTYAPPSDGNDTEGYIAKIKATIKSLVDLSGDAISCSGGGAGEAKDISGTRAELIKLITDSGNFKVVGGNPVLADLNDPVNGAQDSLVKLLAQITTQYNKPINVELIKNGQAPCGDFAQGAQNYGSFTSSHWYGLAADIRGTSPDIDGLYTWLYTNRQVLNLGELEHSPVPDGTKGIKFGADYDYPAAIQKDHQDHIHVAVKGSGQVGPGCTAKPGGETI